MTDSYADDPTITNDALLWRRINPRWIVFDENLGGKRLSTAAFENSKDGTPTSVHLEKVAREIGQTAETLLKKFDGYGMASLTAGQCRQSEQRVGHDPQPDDETHGYIAGTKSNSVKKRLVAACHLFITPADRDT